MDNSDMHAWLSEQLKQKKDSLKFDWSPEVRAEIEFEIKELEAELETYGPRCFQNIGKDS